MTNRLSFNVLRNSQVCAAITVFARCFASETVQMREHETNESYLVDLEKLSYVFCNEAASNGFVSGNSAAYATFTTV